MSTGFGEWTHTPVEHAPAPRTPGHDAQHVWDAAETPLRVADDRAAQRAEHSACVGCSDSAQRTIRRENPSMISVAHGRCGRCARPCWARPRGELCVRSITYHAALHPGCSRSKWTEKRIRPMLHIPPRDHICHASRIFAPRRKAAP